MDKAFRVRFTNWKDGKDEFFFTTEMDAVNYGEKFKKYGYTPEVKPIYFQEIEVN